MEEKIISEEQLETMRHKARKRQNIAIVLTFLAFVICRHVLCCID